MGFGPCVKDMDGSIARKTYGGFLEAEPSEIGAAIKIGSIRELFLLYSTKRG